MVKKVGEVEFNLATLRELFVPEGQQEKVLPKDQLLKKQLEDKFGAVSQADNSTTSRAKYEGRKNFKDVFNQFQENTIDSWYKKPFYGKINVYGLAAFAGIGEDSFVMRAFNDASTAYDRRFKTEKSIITKLKIVQGIMDREALFINNIDFIKQSFKARELEKFKTSNKIKNIDDFYNLLKKYIMESGLPLTMPGFVESPLCSPFSSGLVFDLHDGDPFSDAEKIKWYEDLNFEGFKYILKEHGFKIDPNIPWRIMADLSSSNMWKYLAGQSGDENKGIPDIPVGHWSAAGKDFQSVNLNEIYKNIFQPQASVANVFIEDISFVEIIAVMYNEFIEENPNYKIGSGKNSETIKRKFETADWSEFKWVRWYAEIRNIERGMPLSRRDFKRVIKRVNQIYKFGSVTTKKSWTMFTDVAIKYIEYSLGAIGTKAAKLNKELTVVKKDPILLMNLLEDI